MISFTLINPFCPLKRIITYCSFCKPFERAPQGRRISFSFDRIYLHFLSYCNSARGCLCPDPTTIACLTLIACTPYYCKLLDFAFSSLHKNLTNCPPLQYRFIKINLSCAGSPVVAQVGYLWPLLPLCLCFTADRASARVPPLRVIYGQQLLLQPVTCTAGCQMWSPCKQKLILRPKIILNRD